MIRNYIFTAFRNLIRQKGFTIINILGLTIGLSISFLILFYVFDELSYDRFHYNSDRIYRLVIKGNLGEMNLQAAVTPKALSGEILKEVPDVEASTVFDIESSSYLLRIGEDKIYESDFLYADTSFLNIFNFPLLYGDPSYSLSEPYSIIISESFARKFYGNSDPRGNLIRINEQKDYTITGVFKNLPQESHIGFNFLISMATRISESEGRLMDNWEDLSSYTYVRMHENANMSLFQEKLDTLLFRNILKGEEGINQDLRILPQKITEIHLHSNLLGEIKENGDYSYIFVLLAIATGIILIASINFMNLSTAKSVSRSKEVGIRKILGSQKSMLIGQFISESVIISLISFILSLAIIELSMPVFNDISGKTMSINYLSNWNLLLFFGIAVFTGFLAGSYPAFYLSSFKAIEVLQNRMKFGRSGNLKLRNLLVFIQFTISTGLIICTIIIYLQLNFIKTKELGFEKKGLISIEMRNPEIREKANTLKQEVLKISGVESASLSGSYPGRGLRGSPYIPEGMDEKDPWLIYSFSADEDFAQNTLKMKILQGRDFRKDFGSDSTAILINETLLKKLGWNDPIGKKIIPSYPEGTTNKSEYHIIGVVGDFHFQSLHENVDPIIIQLINETPQLLLIRLNPQNESETISLIGQAWSSLNPDHPFDFDSLDDLFDNLYYSEKRIGKILIYLTLFAIFIASIGLLGLASFTSEQRTKEIGIRKVMGASSLSISYKLSLEYLKMILLAGIVAWPASYSVMHFWLEKFSYRTPMPLWAFALATLITTFLSLLVVNLQTLKTANSNPVKSLRYE
ncbi:MAG: ABC transporter permease [Bacteroidales bacterium]|nr:ABC transporter permease [Bacteroidales bacterium]MCB9012873.1 ABC transporter permease [Bacteroidales bacterium]